MRAVLIPFLFAGAVLAGEKPLAARLPAGATAYVEVRGLAPTIDAALASPLGKAVREHPAMAEFLQSPQGLQMLGGQAMLQGLTGLDYLGLLRAIGSKEIGFAIYGSPQRFVLALRMDREIADKITLGAAMVSGAARAELLPATETLPALWQVGPAFLVHDGDFLIGSPDQLFATAVRNGVAGGGLGAAQKFQAARGAIENDCLVFGYVDLDVYGAALRTGKKPNDLGQALFLGAFAHHLPKAPWAAGGIRLDRDGDAWTFGARAAVPRAGEANEVTEKAFGGTLGELPFALPANTVGILRLRRDLATIWSHRDALVDERGIPGLVEFETNFGNLTGGMSFVEQFLPALGREFVLLGTRREFGDGEAQPSVRVPEGALLWPLGEADGIKMNLEIAFQTAIGILNLQQGQMGGKPFFLGATEYKGTRIQTARYPKPNDAEMEGRTALPMRYNFAPSAAIVGNYFVMASNDGIVRQLIDNYGRNTPAPTGTNAGFWLRGDELRRLALENREFLVAETMLKNGLSRGEAEKRIDLALGLARHLRGARITADEARATVGVSVAVTLGAAKE